MEFLLVCVALKGVCYWHASQAFPASYCVLITIVFCYQMEDEPFLGGSSKGAASFTKIAVGAIAIFTPVAAILVLVAGFGDMDEVTQAP